MESNKSIEQRLESIENLLISQKTVLSFEETARYTGLSKSYLYKLTSGGGIPFYKPQGKHIYFNKEELDKWLLRNRNTTSEEMDSQALSYKPKKRK